MSIVTRYVNTASSGGDGTTIGTTGSTAAYATMHAALVALSGTDLVSSGITAYNIVCMGGVDGTVIDTGDFNITTDATHRVVLQAYTGNEASPEGWKTDRYRLYPTDPVAETISAGFWCNNTSTFKHFDLINLQIGAIYTTVTNLGVAFRSQGQTGDVTIQSCRIRCEDNFGNATGVVFGIFNEGSEHFWNTIIEAAGSSAATLIGYFTFQNVTYSKFYHCGFVNGVQYYSTSDDAVPPLFVNCYFYGHTTPAAGAINSSSDYNSSDLADAPGAHSRNSQTFTFANSGSGDYRLLSSDTACLDHALNLTLSTDWPVNVDMIGTVRPQNVTADIGPFELIVGSIIQPTTQYARYELFGNDIFE